MVKGLFLAREYGGKLFAPQRKNAGTAVEGKYPAVPRASG